MTDGREVAGRIIIALAWISKKPSDGFAGGLFRVRERDLD